MDAVLTEPLPTTDTKNCLTFEENTSQPNKDNFYLFRALALHSRGNQKLEEETSKSFNFFINKYDGFSRNHFQGISI